MTLLALLALPIGCLQSELVTIYGTTFSDDAGPSAVGGASITALDYGLMETGDVTSDAAGEFSVEVRAGGIFYLEMAAPDHLTTGFISAVGHQDLNAGDGLLWLRSEAEMDRIRQEFAGCPGWNSDGGIVEGEIRLFAEGLAAEDSSRAYTGWAKAIDSDGVELEACYLADDEELIAYDPEAEETGFHGRFALFDAPTGPITMAIGYTLEGQPYYETYYYAYVPEHGTMPMYPAWVELY